MNGPTLFEAAETISAAFQALPKPTETDCKQIAKSVIHDSGADIFCFDDAESALAEELIASLHDLYNGLAEDISSLCMAASVGSIALERLAPQLDFSAAQQLERIGPYGKLLSEELPLKTRERWRRHMASRSAETCMELFRLWVFEAGSSIAPIWRFIAIASWKDRVRPRIEAAGHPALSASLIDRFSAAFWAQDRRIDNVGGQFLVSHGQTIAGYIKRPDAPEIPIDISNSLSASHNLNAHRLLRRLVHVGHRQRYYLEKRDFRRIEIDHGLRGLAEQLGLKGGKAADQLRQTLDLFQFIHLELPSREVGGLLTWSLTHPKTGSPAVLTIILGDALLPGYVARLPKGGSTNRRGRMLVPVPERLPPLIGREKDHASQAALQILVMAELRECATDLVEQGAVRITRKQWKGLAELAEVPDGLLAQVIEHWQCGNDQQSAFLKEARREFYTLATPSHQRELNALIEAGQAEIAGRRRAVKRRKFNSHVRFPRKTGALSP